jgi:hypothetical protein
MIERMESPIARVRISHNSTIKDGWRHETTVELTWSERDYGAMALQDLEELCKQADGIGRAEAARRNQVEGRS